MPPLPSFEEWQQGTNAPAQSPTLQSFSDWQQGNPAPPPNPSLLGTIGGFFNKYVISPITNQFNSGVQQAHDTLAAGGNLPAWQEAENILSGASGVATAITAPLAPILNPIGQATTWAGNEIEPAIQNAFPTFEQWAASPGGANAIQGVTDVQNAANVGGLVLGGIEFLKGSIAAQEGGHYTTVNPDSGALGKYQIMPEHLPEIGVPNTAVGRQQFLSSPALQDQLFGKIIDGFAQRYGNDPEKIAAAYYGGEGAVEKLGTPGADVPQGKYPSINEYVKQVLNRGSDMPDSSVTAPDAVPTDTSPGAPADTSATTPPSPFDNTAPAPETPLFNDTAPPDSPIAPPANTAPDLPPPVPSTTVPGSDGELPQEGASAAPASSDTMQPNPAAPATSPDTTVSTPVSTPVTGAGVSKIGQSIEAKAVEAKLTSGFKDTAHYDPINLKDQADQASSLVNSSLENARSIVRGEQPLPAGLRGTSLITAMEEHLRNNPDATIAEELANSPLVSAGSAAAQEMRLMAERTPDSATAKFQEIRAAKIAKAGGDAKAAARRADLVKRATDEQSKVNLSKEDLYWKKFLDTITC